MFFTIDKRFSQINYRYAKFKCKRYNKKSKNLFNDDVYNKGIVFIV